MPVPNTKLRTPTLMFGYTATKLKYADGIDEGRGVITAYIEDGTFACHANTPSMNEISTDYGNDSGFVQRIYCSPSVDITDRDRVRFQDNDYNIVGVYNNGKFKTIDLELT